MSNSCTLHPRVVKNDGTKADSILFDEIKRRTDNDMKLTVSIYGKTKTQQFKDAYPNFIEDKNGEPDINWLMKETNLKTLISEDKTKNFLMKENDLYKYKDPEFIIPENYSEIKKSCVAFNRKENKDYIAEIYQTEDGKNGVQLVKRTIDSRQKAMEMDTDTSIEASLKNILKEYGVEVGALTELDKRTGVNGVTDFSVHKKNANGLIEMIRLAKGNQGQQALPEEFSHFMIEALYDKSPLVPRLIKYISDNGIAQDILGEDYDSYVEAYNGNDFKLAKEAAGKLLAQKIKKIYGVQEENPTSQTEKHFGIIDRIFDFFKSVFGKFDESKIKKAMIEANSVATDFAKQILNGETTTDINLGEIGHDEKFFQINNAKAKAKASSMTREEEKLKAILAKEEEKLEWMKNSKKSAASIKYQEEKIIEPLKENILKKQFYVGFHDYVLNSLKSAANLTKNVKAMLAKGNLTLQEKMAIIKRLQTFVDTNGFIIEEMRAEIPNFENLTDDEKEALDHVCDQAMGKTDILQTVINRNTKEPVFEFFKGYCPDKVTITTGSHKGETISIVDEINAINGDISFKNRWMDSMEDAGDDVLSLFSIITKTAKDKTRQETIKYRIKIDEITQKLKKAGVKDTSFMFERNADGTRNGMYISEEAAKKMGGAKYQYYHDFMAMKKKLDGYLPDYRIPTSRQTIKVRKDGIERIKTSKNKVKNILTLLKEKFVLNENDIAKYGTGGSTRAKAGKKLNTLPLYLIDKTENETEEDMSEDCSGCLLAYAAMANDYDKMNEIIDGIEVARNYLAKNRLTRETDWKGDVMKDKNGNIIYKETGQTKWLERLDDFIEMQVFGNYSENKTSFFGTKLSIQKSIDSLSQLTALNALSFNLMTQISNVTTGTVQMLIEQSGGNHFKSKNVFNADKNYSANIGAFIAEFGSPIQTNKIALFDEMFNVLQKYETESKDANYVAGRMAHVLTPSLGLLGQSMGEHWMQNRTAMALADAYKMKDDKGNECSLWDALEVQYKDPKNKTGAYLAIKSGYTKTDGSKFTNEDITKFSLQSAHINNHMHGIYNQLDKSAIQKYALGRACVMFRKHLVPSLNKRFGSGKRNIVTNEWEEGYWRSTMGIAVRLFKNMKKIGIAAAISGEHLSDEEKINLKRAETELAIFISICIVTALVGKLGDDKNDVWAARMAKYQLLRLRTEVGALTPNPIMVTESMKLLDSPAAALSTVENLSTSIQLLEPSKYQERVKSGQYKGDLKAYKAFMNLSLPGLSQIKMKYKVEHPESLLKYYELQ